MEPASDQSCGASIKDPVPGGDISTSPLRRIALRIARNREVLGLHYSSRTAASKHLAERSFEIQTQCESFDDTDTESIVSKASEEWAYCPVVWRERQHTVL